MELQRRMYAKHDWATLTIQRMFRGFADRSYVTRPAAADGGHSDDTSMRRALRANANHYKLSRPARNADGCRAFQ